MSVITWGHACLSEHRANCYSWDGSLTENQTGRAQPINNIAHHLLATTRPCRLVRRRPRKRGCMLSLLRSRDADQHPDSTKPSITLFLTTNNLQDKSQGENSVQKRSGIWSMFLISIICYSERKQFTATSMTPRFPNLPGQYLKAAADLRSSLMITAVIIHIKTV